MIEPLYRGCTMADLMVRAIQRYPDRIAFIHGERTLTYRETGAMISRAVQVFKSLGLKRGQGIAQLSANRPEAFIVRIAAYYLGLRETPLHPLGSIDDHAYIVEDAEISLLVVDGAAYAEKGAAIAAKVPALAHVLSHGASVAGPDLWALADGFEPLPLEPEANEEDIAFLAYTGGTTGRPKGVIHTHRSLVMNVLQTLAEWEWPAEIRFLAATPITHATGVMILPTLLRGGSFDLVNGFYAEAFLHEIETRKITATFLVPTMIYVLLDHPKTKDADLSSLQMVIYGAAPMSPARMQEAMRRFGPVFMQLYAQTEAPNTVTVLRQADHDPNQPELLASCGHPIAGNQVRLLDEQCKEVPLGEVGEICVRGPLVMEGYWKKPAETEEALRGGWLHTGDMAKRDERGYLYIVDRRKDMIVSGGFNVFPREIEDVLTAHPAVAMAGVVGVPDEKWGEAVKAVVVLKPGRNTAAEELIALVKEKKGAVYAPKSVDFVESLPLTALGKADKKALRARYWAGETRQVH